MNKNKDYTKMILNRLNNKPNNCIKSNSNSNQKTQSTPTHYQPSTDPKTFFQEFQINCAVYHQPVILKPNRKPFIRPLYFQLTEMQYKNVQRMNEPHFSNRIARQPTRVSQFVCQQPRKAISKSVYLENKDYRSGAYKKSEQKITKMTQSNQYRGYQSLKTLPSYSSSTNLPSYVSNIYTCHYGSHYPNSGISTSRRILVPQQRKDSLQMRNLHKVERRRLQPREQLMKRCESFQKFYLGRAV